MASVKMAHIPRIIQNSVFSMIDDIDTARICELKLSTKELVYVEQLIM